MPFSGTSFSEIEQARSEVAGIIAANQRRLATAKAEFGRIASDMTSAGTEYGSIVAAAAALLATAPGNIALQVLNESVQRHLADFNAVSSEATSLDIEVNT
jgi:hypothetical protein